MNKRSVFFSYIVTVVLSIFLIQCSGSDFTFKGEKSVNQTNSNEGELNKAEDYNDALNNDLPDNSTVTIKIDDTIIETRPSTPKPPVEDKKLDTSFTLSTSSNPVIGETITIKGKLKDSNEHPIKDAVINLEVKGKVEPSCKTNDSGAFEFSYEVKESGLHSIKVSYEGDDTHNKVEKSETFNASKISSSLSIITSPADIHEGDTLVIEGNLLTKNNSPIQSASVTIDVNGDKKTVTTNQQGEFSRSLTLTAIGEYHLTVSYEGDNRYSDSVISTNINVTKELVPEKISTIISLNSISGAKVGQNVNIKGTLKDDAQNPISGATITLKIGGVVQPSMTTNASGEFSSLYKVKRAGQHCVSVAYEETDTYKKSTVSKNFTATINTKLEITIDKPEEGWDSFFVGESINIHGSLLKLLGDTSEPGEKDAVITIKINSNSFTVSTDNNGQFSYSYVPTTVDTYNVTVSYAGDSQYNPSNTSNTFEVVEVKKTIPTLSAATHDIKSGENTTISVFVPSDATGTVDIDVSGVGSYTNLRPVRKTVTLNVTKPAEGKHFITVKYNGDANYQSISFYFVFDVSSDQKPTPTISFDPIGTVKVGQEMTISGQLKIDSTPFANAQLFWSAYKAFEGTIKTDSQGKFSFKRIPKYVAHTCTHVSFLGNETVNPTKSSKDFVCYDVEK